MIHVSATYPMGVGVNWLMLCLYKGWGEAAVGVIIINLLCVP